MSKRLKQTLLQRRCMDGQEADEEMLNITNYQRNVNQNYETSPYTSQNDYHQKVYKEQILEKMWRKENLPTLLVGM